MSEKHLHIVSFDIPFPADYGGVIDVFYKVKALHALGIKVHLHCFAYGREATDELKKYCVEVYYYPRNMNKTLLIHPLPFIVVSRHHDALLERLLQDRHPILFEGLHCGYYLDHHRLKDRPKFLRTHNVEHEYYQALAAQEHSWLKRIYLRKEAKKLEQFERQCALPRALFAISPKDLEHFKKWNEKVTYIPPFHSNEELAPNGGKKPFALYHGSLSVMENERAAEFLVDQVFNDSEKSLKVFGKGASPRLVKKIARTKNIELIDGDAVLLQGLVQEAQVNILPTFQATGMKLKLLFSLFNGGHCLVNEPMVEGTGLETCCEVTADASGMKASLEKLWNTPYSSSAYEARKEILQRDFSNAKQARKMVNKIFPNNNHH